MFQWPSVSDITPLGQITTDQVKYRLQQMGIRRFDKRQPEDLAVWIQQLREAEGITTGRTYAIGAALKECTRLGMPRPSIARLKKACWLAGPSVQPRVRIHRMTYQCEGANHVLSIGNMVCIDGVDSGLMFIARRR